jgi:hypothetical protein
VRKYPHLKVQKSAYLYGWHAPRQLPQLSGTIEFDPGHDSKKQRRKP